MLIYVCISLCAVDLLDSRGAPSLLPNGVHLMHEIFQKLQSAILSSTAPPVPRVLGEVWPNFWPHGTPEVRPWWPAPICARLIRVSRLGGWLRVQLGGPRFCCLVHGLVMTSLGLLSASRRTAVPPVRRRRLPTFFGIPAKRARFPAQDGTTSPGVSRSRLRPASVSFL